MNDSQNQPAATPTTDTMASEGKTHHAPVLEMPVGITPEERLDALRNVMMTGFAPILEACISNLPLPAQREAFLVETAHFVSYYLAVQLNDDRKEPLELRTLMQAWRTLHKDMDKTVTAQMHAIIVAHRQGTLDG